MYAMSRYSTSGLRDSEASLGTPHWNSATTYVCCRTASEIHVTKRDVNPRIATGGVMPEVIELTKRAILSAVGALEEYA